MYVYTWSLRRNSCDSLVNICVKVVAVVNGQCDKGIIGRAVLIYGKAWRYYYASRKLCVPRAQKALLPVSSLAGSPDRPTDRRARSLSLSLSLFVCQERVDISKRTRRDSLQSVPLFISFPSHFGRVVNARSRSKNNRRVNVTSTTLTLSPLVTRMSPVFSVDSRLYFRDGAESRPPIISHDDNPSSAMMDKRVGRRKVETIRPLSLLPLLLLLLCQIARCVNERFAGARGYGP